ncbi:P2X purinoceptor 7-like [Ornithodoros turicata]|uniref:P2X purinoceptor 7-like n=1 Tax=Ornithodoros turicata TaxID=34597 RepID=UPI0031399375
MSSLPNLSALELRILELSRAQNFCSYDSMPESVCVAAEDSSSSDIPESPPSSPGSDRAGNADWCSCAKCKPMDTADECLCCREVENVCKKQTVNCITDNEYFEILCLDTEVLRVSFTYIRDTEEYGNTRDIAVNKKFRYIAYRQFTRWIWGGLGKHHRKILPACVVYAIRDAFPSDVYKGFEPAHL